MLKKSLVLILLVATTNTFAGNWQVKVGGTILAPTADNGQLAGGAVTGVEAKRGYSLTPSVEYFFTDTNLSTELLLATPFKHDVTSNGTKIASFKHLPPTVTVKYNFNNSTPVTPYVGLGGTMVIPFGEKTTGPIAGTKLDAKVAFGVAAQVGAIYKPDPAQNWGIFFDTRYVNVKSDLKLNGESIGTLKVNPLVYTLGVSYKF
ncbi:OmpW/AlkL family protein [Acinetobacter rathckeae]|uniref:OmpW/AlkL family protein n=1 Tax=Acinetobacter rathckeae TaxID=2605272 RepID=UPI0018A30416|nr:OmpW family outer membrane protein [Acinetobacter rathckeae]MBF7695440.1 OmpW family protein [Acinetobacter rathckeae]